MLVLLACPRVSWQPPVLGEGSWRLLWTRKSSATAKPNTGPRARDGALAALCATSLMQVVCGLGGFQEVESFRKQPQIKHWPLWLLHAAGQPMGASTAAGTPSGSRQRGCALPEGKNRPAMCQLPGTPPAGTCQIPSRPAASPAQAMLRSSDNARELLALVPLVTSPQTASEGADLWERLYMPLL